MKLTVLKPFTSTLRRFAMGDIVDDGDDFSPRTADDLKAENFIGDGKVLPVVDALDKARGGKSKPE